MGSEQDRTGSHQSEGENLSTPASQRDLSTDHEGVKPVGKQTLEYEIWSSYNVRMDPSVAEYLRSLGGGEIHEGVRIVTRFYRERFEQDK